MRHACHGGAETLLINLISWRLPSVYLFDRSGPFVGTYSASGTFLSIWDFQALADLGIGIAGFPSQYSKFSPFSAQCPVGLIVPVSSPVPEKRTGTGIFQPSKILGKHCRLLTAYTGLISAHWHSESTNCRSKYVMRLPLSVKQWDCLLYTSPSPRD